MCFSQHLAFTLALCTDWIAADGERARGSNSKSYYQIHTKMIDTPLQPFVYWAQDAEHVYIKVAIADVQVRRAERCPKDTSLYRQKLWGWIVMKTPYVFAPLVKALMDKRESTFLRNFCMTRSKSG